VFRQEVGNGRARCSQLQEALHQKATELDAARAAQTAAQQEQAAAVARQQQVEQQLQEAQRGNVLLQQQCDKVCGCWVIGTLNLCRYLNHWMSSKTCMSSICDSGDQDSFTHICVTNTPPYVCRQQAPSACVPQTSMFVLLTTACVQAQGMLSNTLQQLESLESRVSLVSSSSLSISSGTPQGQTLDAAIEAALHLLERLFVSMQCLAADAATISNASNACKVEVLVGGIMQGLEAAAGQQQQQQQQQGSGPPGAAANLVLLRNAAGAAGKQRCSELERQLSTLQLQLADTMSQLVSMSSANARLQRMLNLKTRAAASLDRQVGAVETQLQHMQAQQAATDSSMAQMQQELAAARLQQSKASAECSARAAELQAAQSRANVVEAALQQLQAAAEATEASTDQLTERLQQAMEKSRQEVTATAGAQRQHAAAALQAEQLQQQLTVASARVAELEKEVRECRHKVDICSQAARNAEYRAVETTTRLADLRREFDLSQQQQPTQQQRAAAG
jgi:hypothetical protein